MFRSCANHLWKNMFFFPLNDLKVMLIRGIRNVYFSSLYSNMDTYIASKLKW